MDPDAQRNQFLAPGRVLEVRVGVNPKVIAYGEFSSMVDLDTA